MTLCDALDRTLLLMRDEFDESATDAMLLSALTGTRIALIADEKNISTHSAQTAFATAAMLMARSAHDVILLAPNVEMKGPQPPLRPGCLIERLLETGADLLPGVTFAAGLSPDDEVDLAIALGDSFISVRARRVIRLNADPWTGRIQRQDDFTPWIADHWPLGAMAAAAMAATEAFKTTTRKLRTHALNPARMSTVFAPTEELVFALAPPLTRFSTDVGRFDCVSGGAITNALLYALLHIPDVKGEGRLIEPDFTDLTNLNRYMLLLRSRLKTSKAVDLAAICGNRLRLEPIEKRYEPSLLDELRGPAPAIIVGVDDIPTRWAVQQANPKWLGIGATTHWSAMASFHRRGLGCAQCLHFSDDPSNAPIPTAAFVSFWSGLLTAAYFLRYAAGEDIAGRQQQIYLTPFRAENPVRSPVPIRPNCPTCQAMYPSQAAA